MEQIKKRIMLVEDDKNLSFITKMQLERYDYDVVQAYSAAEAEQFIEEGDFDLILMDVMLPDGDGIEVVKKIRSDQIGYAGPVVFMSCIGDGNSIVDSFRTGGNDYLIKPVDPEVLVSRIEENLKFWLPQKENSKVMYYKHFCVDTSRHEVRLVKDKIAGEIVELSPTEYKILEVLTAQKNEIILYEELYRKAWGEDYIEDIRPLMVHVSNLRKKLDSENVGFIKAIRGTGYIFVE